MTALAHRGYEDPAGRDGPGLGEQQTLFGGERVGEWAGTGHLGYRGEEQTRPPPESVVRGRAIEKGWRAPAPLSSYRRPHNSHPTSLNILALQITFAGGGSGLIVLWVPRENPAPQYDVVLKRVPALPPGPAWECELSLPEPHFRAVVLCGASPPTPLPPAQCLACHLCCPSPRTLSCCPLHRLGLSQLRPHGVPSRRTYLSWQLPHPSF